jgi:hypothetical protein
MGQRISEDIIATPSHSGGTITLPPSLLTLGGRQYRTGVLQRTIATDVTLVANTLYFVYAQIVSTVPALRISTSVPSTYKVANPTAKLVTGFLSTGEASPAFGAFASSVSGVPNFDNISYAPTYSASLGPATDLNTVYSVSGKKVVMLLRGVTNGVSAALATASLPFPYSGTSVKIVGTGWAGNEAEGKFVYGDNVEPTLLKFGEVNSGNAYGAFQNANAVFSSTNNFSFHINYTSDSLSEVPLEKR